MVLRVGVLSRLDPGWTAGGAYTRMLLTALARTQPSGAELAFLAEEGDPTPLPAGVQRAVLPAQGLRRFFPLEAQARATLGLGFHGPLGFPGEAMGRRVAARLLGEELPLSRMAQALGLDVVLPVGAVGPHNGRTPKYISWIPDFQYVHQPQFFSPEQLERRRRNDELSARNADAILLSSNDAMKDYQRLFPDGAPATVAQFPSSFAFEEPLDAPEVLDTYRIPERFALVVNQWWAHKNHQVVLEAAEILKQLGTPVPVVFVGMPWDPRQPTNATASSIMQEVVKRDLRTHVWLLGMVPHIELHGLLRRATVLVQPSMFEGWSTSIEDAKALGCPVVASDLAVHREQGPAGTACFGLQSPQHLARLVDAAVNRPTVRTPQQLAGSLLAAGQRGRVFGEKLWQVVQEAAVTTRATGLAS